MLSLLTALGRTMSVGLPALLFACAASGCGGGTSAFQFFGGTPFEYDPSTLARQGGVGLSQSAAGGQIDASIGGSGNPCNETQSRKFIRISLRNLSADYIHYFLILIAYVNGDTYPDGAVCPDDIQLYVRNGYIQIREGDQIELGNICIRGPALYYYHENGQFRGATGSGSTALASAIAPAQGSAATYDAFFASAGASLPVPNAIVFHNPGTGEGAALKISRNDAAPCSDDPQQVGDPACRQDAFYYVDADDRITGSTALGFGSGRRVPDEIQGTGCSCGLSNDPWALLAPANLDASDISRQSAYCNRFLRGGRIDFAFVREDTDPPYPQLVWQVTDSRGSQAQQFDARADIP